MGKKNAVEFMKIRRYVLNLIATGGDMPQRIPSSRKLGEMFGVTHPTALRAIQALTEDGYLQPLRGGGSITCPANCNLKNTRLFGFLEGDGKIAIDIYYTVCLYSIAARELTRRNLTYCCQHLYLNSPADLESMIQENHLAGLVALNIRLPELKAEVCRMKERGVPVISLFGRLPGVSSCGYSYQEYYAMGLNRLFREKRREIVILVSPAFTIDEAIRAAVKEQCALHSVPEERVLILKDTPEMLAEQLEEMLQAGRRFDGVIGNHAILPSYEILDQYLDLEQECRVINSEFTIYDEMKYTGYAINFDWGKVVPDMIDDLLLQTDSQDVPVKNQTIGLYFTFYKNGTQVFSEKN